MSRSGPGKAAGLGAIGCLGTFLALGVIFVAMGGSIYADAGGIIMLLVIGAVLGLIVWAIYDKGRRDATGGSPLRPGRTPPPSVDELIAEAERDLRDGRIDHDEYERRVRRAWGHPD